MMKEKNCILVYSFLILSFFALSLISVAYAQTFDQDEILIASWNLLNFGEGRADVDENLQVMTDIITGSNYDEVGRNYDLIFVQELKSDGIAFDNLCNNYLINLDYSCLRTPQLSGTGTNNESYGVIFKNGINVTVEDTSNEESVPNIPQGIDQDAGEMVRPPMKATVTVSDDFQFIVYNNHIKPGDPDTANELSILQDAINQHHGFDTEDMIIVLGDLNADGKPEYHKDGTRCGSQYLVGGFENHPGLFDNPDWQRIFTNDNYTNFATNPCAYDNIIPNNNMASFFTGDYGIIGVLPDGTSFGKYPSPGFKAGGKLISDHKLVWAKFSLEELSSSVEDCITSDNDGIIIEICYGDANVGENLSIDVSFDTPSEHAENVNYDIIATQNDEVILEFTDEYDDDGYVSYDTDPLPAKLNDDNPVDVGITFNGYGIPGEDEFTGPSGKVIQKQIVPEFGTISGLVLIIAITSILAITTKSRLITKI